MSWLGLLAALGAMLAWGFGDHFMQKTTRLIGTTKSLFYVGLGGFLMLTPFLRPRDFALLANPRGVIFMLAAFVAAMFASRLYFKALKLGKGAVIEPIIALVLPITVVLSVFVWGERLTLPQFASMAMVFVGLVLAVSVRLDIRIREAALEYWAMLAFVGAIGMALGNFFTGTASQTTSPALTIWFIHGAIAVACALQMAYQRRFVTVPHDLRRHLPLIAVQTVLDTAAWLCFAFAVTLIPISVTAAVGESYVALAILLGVIVSKQKIARHQLGGIGLAAAGVVVLAMLTVWGGGVTN
jgi:drug/metabolite transporter (DMT)-like permease